MEPILADSVADVGDVVHPLGAVEHVEQAVVVHDGRVEHVERLPGVQRVRLEDGVPFIALQFNLTMAHFSANFLLVRR